MKKKILKLKDLLSNHTLLNESYAWERKFGEKLPSLADVQEKYEKKKDEGFTSGKSKDKKNTQTRSEKVGYKMVGEEEKPTFDLSKNLDRGDAEFPSGNLKEESIDLNEDNWDKIQIPATVKRWMNRFIDAMKGVKLERIKKLAILYRIIKALGIDAQELNVYVGRVRRGLK